MQVIGLLEHATVIRNPNPRCHHSRSSLMIDGVDRGMRHHTQGTPDHLQMDDPFWEGIGHPRQTGSFDGP